MLTCVRYQMMPHTFALLLLLLLPLLLLLLHLAARCFTTTRMKELCIFAKAAAQKLVIGFNACLGRTRIDGPMDLEMLKPFLQFIATCEECRGAGRWSTVCSTLAAGSVLLTVFSGWLWLCHCINSRTLLQRCCYCLPSATRLTYDNVPMTSLG